MGSSAIGRIALVIVGLLLALIATSSIFSSGANVLAQSFRYLTPAAMIVGLLAPRMGIGILIVSGAYLDFIKRLLILDSNFSYTDLAFLLALAPAAMGGIVLGILISWLMGTRPFTKREVILFVVVSLIGGVLGGGYAMNGGGLKSAGDAVNASAYLFLLLVIPTLYKSREDLVKLLRFAIIVYLPAALWAVKQGKWGLEDFEMRYLLSGFTIEDRQLNELVFRNMGTMVSAGVLSMVASIFAASLIIPVKWKTGKVDFRSWLNPLLIACVIAYAAGAMYTYSRTGWICAGLGIVIFITLHSRILAYGSVAAGVISLVLLYVFAQQILDSRVLHTWQSDLYEQVATSDSAKQAMVLGTLEGRFDSMAQFAGNADIWTPFGLKMANKEDAVGGHWIHDALTEALVMVGYIPLSIFLLFAAWLVKRILKANFSLEATPERTMMRYFFALGGGMLFAGLQQGKALFVFPMNFFWGLFLSFGYCMYLIGSGKVAPAPVPVSKIPSYGGRGPREEISTAMPSNGG